jgi:hypothetical protein
MLGANPLLQKKSTKLVAKARVCDSAIKDF